jgi:hypothetical protein
MTAASSSEILVTRMSENYIFYAGKMADLRTLRSANRPLQSQLDDLLAFVKACEGKWQPRRSRDPLS